MAAPISKHSAQALLSNSFHLLQTTVVISFARWRV